MKPEVGQEFDWKGKRYRVVLNPFYALGVKPEGHNDYCASICPLSRRFSESLTWECGGLNQVTGWTCENWMMMEEVT